MAVARAAAEQYREALTEAESRHVKTLAEKENAWKIGRKRLGSCRAQLPFHSRISEERASMKQAEERLRAAEEHHRLSLQKTMEELRYAFIRAHNEDPFISNNL
jgi:hypothetical protein